jgi:hypothetical protein
MTREKPELFLPYLLAMEVGGYTDKIWDRDSQLYWLPFMKASYINTIYDSQEAAEYVITICDSQRVAREKEEDRHLYGSHHWEAVDKKG